MYVNTTALGSAITLQCVPLSLTHKDCRAWGKKTQQALQEKEREAYPVYLNRKNLLLKHLSSVKIHFLLSLMASHLTCESQRSLLD